MPNGKPGDRPDTDVVVHGIDVYEDDELNEMIREIARRTEGFQQHTGIDLYMEYYPELSASEAAELRQRLDAVLAALDESAESDGETEDGDGDADA